MQVVICKHTGKMCKKAKDDPDAFAIFCGNCKDFPDYELYQKMKEMN